MTNELATKALLDRSAVVVDLAKILRRECPTLALVRRVKIIREATLCSLREAKDAVYASEGIDPNTQAAKVDPEEVVRSSMVWASAHAPGGAVDLGEVAATTGVEVSTLLAAALKLSHEGVCRVDRNWHGISASGTHVFQLRPYQDGPPPIGWTGKADESDVRFNIIVMPPARDGVLLALVAAGHFRHPPEKKP